MFWVHNNPYRPLLLVREIGSADRTLGRATSAVDLPKGPAEPFGPLKAVLGSIPLLHAQPQVYFYAPFKLLL